MRRSSYHVKNSATTTTLSLSLPILPCDMKKLYKLQKNVQAVATCMFHQHRVISPAETTLHSVVGGL